MTYSRILTRMRQAAPEYRERTVKLLGCGDKPRAVSAPTDRVTSILAMRVAMVAAKSEARQ